MVKYLQVQSAGSIVRNSFGIYFRNWRTIFTIYAIPLLPLQALHAYFMIEEDETTALIVGGVQMLVAIPVMAVLTVAIGDICLGLRPSIVRSYRRALNRPMALLGTYFMAIGIVLLGFLLLVVPGVVFSTWYLFVLPVFVLEHLSGKAALTRTRELGKGHYARNFGVVFLVGLVGALLLFVLSLIGGGMLGFLAGTEVIGLETLFWSMLVLTTAITLLITPIYAMPAVLLYYDMRARKEGYGAAQLTEDLRF